MKKILPRLALLAAPFLVYFALFFAFEPYDYFGVKGGASSEDSVITRVRAYLSAARGRHHPGRLTHGPFRHECRGRGLRPRLEQPRLRRRFAERGASTCSTSPPKTTPANTCYFGVSFTPCVPAIPATAWRPSAPW